MFLTSDLTEGIKNKRLQLLYRGLKRAKKDDLREELDKLFDQANKLFIWLKRIEKINRKVMKLDNVCSFSYIIAISDICLRIHYIQLTKSEYDGSSYVLVTLKATL